MECDIIVAPAAADVNAAGDTVPADRPAVALSWAMLTVMALAATVALAAIGATASLASFPFPLALSAIALAFYHVRRQPIPRILCGVVGVLQLVLIFACGILLSFAAAASGAPSRMRCSMPPSRR